MERTPGTPSVSGGGAARRSGRTPTLKLADGSTISLQPGTRESFASRPPVDICLVFDTTGSMSDKIDGLTSCMTGFVDRLAGLGLDWRMTTVPFGDLTVDGDRVVCDLPFVHSVIAAKALIRQMPRFSGGTNDGESSIEAMRAALSKPWRDRAVKVLVLVTDESAVGAERAHAVSRAIRQAEAICFCVTSDTPYYRTWATQSAGSWVQIAATMETSALLDKLRSLVNDVATVAADVHATAGGSVRRYLELAPAERRRRLRANG